MKRNAKTIIAGVIALAMSHAVMAEDIKVAVVGAMSGPVAQWGDMEFNGARQAIKDINAKGGIKGDKLVGVEYDDACDPKQAVSVANTMVNKKIVFMHGHWCSSSTIPASDVYNEAQIPMATVSTNPQVTERGLKNIFRIMGRDDQQGLVAGGYLADKLHKAGAKLVMTDVNTALLSEVAARTGAVLRHIPVHDDGTLDLDAAASLIGDRTRIVDEPHRRLMQGQAG